MIGPCATSKRARCTSVSSAASSRQRCLNVNGSFHSSLPRACQRSRHMGRLLFPLLVLGCALGACDRTSLPATPASASPEPVPAVSRAEVERLQALGYVDVATEPVEEGRSGVILHDAARS